MAQKITNKDLEEDAKRLRQIHREIEAAFKNGEIQKLPKLSEEAAILREKLDNY